MGGKLGCSGTNMLNRRDDWRKWMKTARLEMQRGLLRENQQANGDEKDAGDGRRSLGLEQ